MDRVYLARNSDEQSSSWKASVSSANQEISHNLWIPTFNYRVKKQIATWNYPQPN